MATIVEQLRQNTALVMAGKGAIEEAIIAKGGTVPENPDSGIPTFSGLVAGVNSISGSGNTLKSPQSQQTRIASYVISGETGNLKINLESVTDENYDSSYIVARESETGIEFPISEDELIPAVNNVAEVPNSTTGAKYSVLAITKDKAGIYQTMINDRNLLKGISGVSTIGEAKEVLLPEEFQQYSSFNAVLDSNGVLYLSSNTTDLKGLWAFKNNAFSKIYTDGYSWKYITEVDGKAFIASGATGFKVLMIDDDGSVNEVTDTNITRSTDSVTSIKFKDKIYLGGIGGNIYKYDVSTKKLVLLKSINSSCKFIPTPDDYLLTSSGSNTYLIDATDDSLTKKSMSFYAEKYKIIDDIIFLYSGGDNLKIACYTSKEEDIKQIFDMYIDYASIGAKSILLEKDGNIYITIGSFQKFDKVSRSFVALDGFDPNVFFCDIKKDSDGDLYGITNTQKLYYINFETKTYDLIDLTFYTTANSYEHQLEYLTNHKFIVEIVGSYAYQSRGYIVDVLEKSILKEKQGSNYVRSAGFIKVSDGVVLSKPGYKKYSYVYNGLINEITEINGAKYHKENDSSYTVFPDTTKTSNGELISKVKVDGTIETNNTYSCSYLGLGIGLDNKRKKLYNYTQEIGTILGEYTGTPITNNGATYFVFDTRSTTKRVLFTC